MNSLQFQSCSPLPGFVRLPLQKFLTICCKPRQTSALPEPPDGANAAQRSGSCSWAYLVLSRLAEKGFIALGGTISTFSCDIARAVSRLGVARCSGSVNGDRLTASLSPFPLKSWIGCGSKSGSNAGTGASSTLCRSRTRRTQCSTSLPSSPMSRPCEGTRACVALGMSCGKPGTGSAWTRSSYSMPATDATSSIFAYGGRAGEAVPRSINASPCSTPSARKTGRSRAPSSFRTSQRRSPWRGHPPPGRLISVSVCADVQFSCDTAYSESPAASRAS